MGGKKQKAHKRDARMGQRQLQNAMHTRAATRRAQQSPIRNYQGTLSADDEDSEGYLQIGGVRVRVDSNSNGTISHLSNRTQRKKQQRQPSSPSESDHDDDNDNGQEQDSDGFMDYLRNLQQNGQLDEDDDDFEKDFQIALGYFARIRIGHEGAPEDVIGRMYDDDESEDSIASSSSEFSDNTDDDDDDDDKEEEVILREEELNQLDPALRYPISIRPPPPPPPPLDGGATLWAQNNCTNKNNKKKNKKNKQQMSAAATKYFPGEKSRLRHERIEAKRAHRAVDRGFDLASVRSSLDQLMASGHDVHAFPPMPKQECRQIQKLASLYGLKSGAQGSGKKRRVVVTMTERAAVPSGPALLEVGRMLAAFNAQLLSGGDDIYGSGVGSGVGRWKGVASAQKKKNKKNKKYKVDGMDDGALPWPSSSSLKRRLSQPVSFVSRGMIAGDEEVEEAPQEILDVYEDRPGARNTNANTNANGKSKTEVGAGKKVSYDRGTWAAEGISNSGRLVGLSMALGLGSEVFEAISSSTAPPAATSPGVGVGMVGKAPLDGHQEVEEKEEVDVSPLHPMLSKSEQKRRGKRKGKSSSKGGGDGGGGGGGGGSGPSFDSLGKRDVSGDFADFEQHTKGIGGKLLAKMGWTEGQGLGRARDGIAEPLQVKVRAKKLGLGAE